MSQRLTHDEQTIIDLLRQFTRPEAQIAIVDYIRRWVQIDEQLTLFRLQDLQEGLQESAALVVGFGQSEGLDRLLLNRREVGFLDALALAQQIIHTDTEEV